MNKNIKITITLFLFLNIFFNIYGFDFAEFSQNFLENYKEYELSMPELDLMQNVKEKTLNNYKKIKDLINPFISKNELLKTNSNFIQSFQENIFFNNPDFWINYRDIDHLETNKYMQKLQVPINSTVYLKGDIHGNVFTLIRDLWRLIFLGYINNNLEIINPNFYMIFLGDYINRNVYSIETLYLLQKLYLANKKNNHVILTRGNHETINILLFYMPYEISMLNELESKYNKDKEEILSNLYESFKFFPSAIFLGTQNNNNFIICAHSGINLEIENFNNVNQDLINLFNTKNKIYYFSPNINSQHYDSEICQLYENINWDLPITDACRGTIFCPSFITNILFKIYPQIKGIFRGHTHNYYGIKMLYNPQNLTPLKLKDNHPYYTKTVYSPNILGPFHWTNVVPENLINNPEGIPLENEAYLPIFTIASPFGGVGIYNPYDSFVLLTTKQEIKDWRLKIHEIPLWKASNSKPVFEKISNGKYLKICKNYQYKYPENPDPIIFKYSNYNDYSQKLNHEMTQYFHTTNIN